MIDEFKNIREAHSKFNFPGSYRTGTLMKDNIVIRIYSNSIVADDYFQNNENFFNYVIKNQKIYEAFKNNKNKNIFIHVFKRNILENKVNYFGLYKVKGFRKNNKYVLLEKI